MLLFFFYFIFYDEYALAHPTEMQIQFISLIDSYELFNSREKKQSKLHDFKPEWIDFHCSFLLNVILTYASTLS